MRGLLIIMFSFCNTPKQHFGVELSVSVYYLGGCYLAMFVFIISSEEVFDFSSGQMTQAKAKHLKDRLESMEIEFTVLISVIIIIVII